MGIVHIVLSKSLHGSYNVQYVLKERYFTAALCDMLLYQFTCWQRTIK